MRHIDIITLAYLNTTSSLWRTFVYVSSLGCAFRSISRFLSDFVNGMSHSLWHVGVIIFRINSEIWNRKAHGSSLISNKGRYTFASKKWLTYEILRIRRPIWVSRVRVDLMSATNIGLVFIIARWIEKGRAHAYRNAHMISCRHHTCATNHVHINLQSRITLFVSRCRCWTRLSPLPLWAPARWCRRCDPRITIYLDEQHSVDHLFSSDVTLISMWTWLVSL